MKTFIFGVGRSGTTMIYHLLQSMLESKYGDKVDYVYEPFLWDRASFNGHYNKVKPAFAKVASLSVTGIYHHQQLPMFINDHDRCPEESGKFLAAISRPQNPKTHLLAKIIRANGRMTVFRAINPKARFVFIIRNPLDTINSLKNKFSFYGDDFYPSDYPRFRQERQLSFNGDTPGWAQQQVEYWYQMNLSGAAFVRSDPDTLILDYDSFIANKTGHARQICEFLQIDYLPKFGSRLRSPVGPVTANAVLSQREIAAVSPYMQHYREICSQLGIEPPDESMVLEKYAADNANPDYDLEYEGASPILAKLAVRSLRREKAELQQQLNRHNSRQQPDTTELKNKIKRLASRQQTLEEAASTQRERLDRQLERIDALVDSSERLRNELNEVRQYLNEQTKLLTERSDSQRQRLDRQHRRLERLESSVWPDSADDQE